jgi:putative hemolysin
MVIALLWKGIAEYMNLSKAQTLIGCSSVKVSHSRDAALIFHYLSTQGHLCTQFGAQPTPDFEMDQFATWYDYFRENFSESLANEAEEMLPSLLKSYLKMGAKIIAEPAFDKDFNCIDLLTMLEKDQLLKSAGKKFGVA